ncbi:MAG: hypothetical protein D6750_03110 [Bacteroidetes bacterium]|nr:MAG: hypothetical protein D6750_03110 [Bacteroidota bacterium]
MAPPVAMAPQGRLASRATKMGAAAAVGGRAAAAGQAGWWPADEEAMGDNGAPADYHYKPTMGLLARRVAQPHPNPTPPQAEPAAQAESGTLL